MTTNKPNSKVNLSIEVSARHIHLNKSHLKVLFGSGYELRKERDLSLSTIFAAQETVKLKGPKGSFSKVRIVGPLRHKTQVEVSTTDCFHLGVDPVLRKSGCLEKTPGIKLVGPKGEVNLKQGLIVPWRHIHLSPNKAQELSLENNQMVKARVEKDRGLVFNQVQIRVEPSAEMVMHIDTDEGNAAGIIKKATGFLIL